MPWAAWRGPNRDGIAPWLPARLPEKPRVVWKKSLFGPGLAGIAVTERVVIVADRDPADTSDAFRALDAATGAVLWTLRYLAPARFDYGNAPRATPLIVGERAYLYGAAGHLHCVELASGNVVWKKDLRKEFDVHDEIPWGMCSSPLAVDGKLIVNPGAADASLVALDLDDGHVVWKCPGDAAAFSSFIVGAFGGKRQIVGYDKTSLGGWDTQTGRRLWRLVPPRANDFNVPTPIEFEGQLIVSTENNGTRIYRFNSDGTIVPKPIAENSGLAPDTHTPVVLGGRLFGTWDGLHCLDVRAGLKEIWSSDDAAFFHYCTLLGSRDRVLVVSQEGELVLLDPAAVRFEPISRLKLFDDDSGVYAHPAPFGNLLYVRNSTGIYCLDLAEGETAPQ